MAEHEEERLDGLQKFLEAYGTLPNAVVQYVDVEPEGREQFVVIRCGEWVAVVNPIPTAKALSVDVHSFVGGVAHKARVAGFPYGHGEFLPNGHDYPLAAIIIGEEGN